MISATAVGALIDVLIVILIVVALAWAISLFARRF
jgi:hypothetical protein